MNIVLCLVLVALSSCGTVEAAKDGKKKKLLNIAEVLFVVDQKTEQAYKGYGHRTNTRAVIEEEVEFFVGQVNELLATLKGKDGIKVKVVPVDIMFLDGTNMILAKNDVASDGWTVSVDTLLRKFASWTSKLKQPDFDMAILLSGYYMTRGRSTVQGLAYKGRLCDKTYGTAVVYSDGSTLTASHIAHEIGHILNSTHDDGGDCKTESDSVMILKSDYRTHFSSCSKKQIVSKVSKLSLTPGKNCMLTNAHPESANYKAPTTAPAALLNPHKLCERKYGPTGTMCLTSRNMTGYYPSGSGICKRLECCFPAEGYWGTVQATNGLVCGQNKRCQMGKCKKTTQATPFGLDEKCLFGDTTYIRYKGKVQSCSQAVSKTSREEVCSKHSSECCDTCNFDSNLGKRSESKPNNIK